MLAAPLRRLAASALLLAALGAAGCTDAGAVPTARPSGATFENPIADVGQDPFVTEWQDRYLLVETRDDSEIWVVRSRPDDLVGVAREGEATRVWAAPQRGGACTDIWAPELHRVGERWYVYYAATTCDGDSADHRMFVLESEGDDPLGPYRDRGALADAAGRWAIDGTPVELAGERYLVWSGWAGDGAEGDEPQHLWIARMDGPLRLASDPVLIASPELEWERRGAPVLEGPQALVRGDRTMLVYSASGSWTDDYCYGLLTWTGGDPLSAASWTKAAEPVFARTGTVFGPGHGSFVTSPDGTEPWMVYHSAIAQGSGWFRQVNAQPFAWRPDGSPDFGRPADPATPIPLPSGSRP